MKFIIPGDPIPQKRHRSTSIGGFVRQYDPQVKEKNAVKKIIENACLEHNYKKEDGCSYIVNAEFNFKPPKSTSESIKNLMLWGIIPHDIKPDRDNLDKFILDCGNGILWPDDCKINAGKILKQWADEPSTIIEITKIQRGNMTPERENVFKIFSPKDMQNFDWNLHELGCHTYYMSENNSRGIKTIETKEGIADSMIEFADKWADKLKKIKVRNENVRKNSKK